MKIIVAPIPMPSSFAPDLPPAFDRWWDRASQRDPAARFQSARELGDSLGLALGLSQGVSADGGMRAPALSDPGTGNYPAVGTGTLGITPQPTFGNTPQPMYPGANIPHAMGPTTGATMSRTFDGPVGPPVSRKGLFVALGGGAAVLLALGVVGVTFAMKGSSKDTSGAADHAPAVPPPPTAAAPVAPAPPPQAVVSAAPVEVVLPHPAPAMDPTPTPSAPNTRPAHAQVAAPPRPAPPPAVSAPPKKAKVDLGI